MVCAFYVNKIYWVSYSIYIVFLINSFLSFSHSLISSQVFKEFLKGQNIEMCYAAVGTVCNEDLDLLYTHGANVDDEEMFELLSESHTTQLSTDFFARKSHTAQQTKQNWQTQTARNWHSHSSGWCKYHTQHKLLMMLFYYHRLLQKTVAEKRKRSLHHHLLHLTLLFQVLN